MAVGLDNINTGEFGLYPETRPAAPHPVVVDKKYNVLIDGLSDAIAKEVLDPAVQKIGAVYESHKRSSTTPLQKTKILTGIVFIQSTIIATWFTLNIGGAFLASPLVGLVIGVSIIGLGVLAGITGKIFINSFKKQDLDLPKDRIAIAKALKELDLEKLLKTHTYEQIGQYALFDQAFASHVKTPEDKAAFYIHLKQFLERKLTLAREVQVDVENNKKAFTRFGIQIRPVQVQTSDGRLAVIQKTVVLPEWQKWIQNQTLATKASYENAKKDLDDQYRSFLDSFCIERKVSEAEAN